MKTGRGEGRSGITKSIVMLRFFHRCPVLSSARPVRRSVGDDRVEVFFFPFVAKALSLYRPINNSMGISLPQSGGQVRKRLNVECVFAREWTCFKYYVIVRRHITVDLI